MVNLLKYRDDLRRLLKTIFDPGLKWGENQIKSYELIRHYLSTFRVKFLQSNQSRDKYIIIDNLKGQSWYKKQNASVNSIITGLIDQMTIITEDSLATELTKVLNLVIEFRDFKLYCYYYQHVGEIIALQIFLSFDQPLPANEKPTINRNYLAYYIKGKITCIPDDIQAKMEIPEINDLNEQTKINETMISAQSLMFFFLEIILYYDETETIANVKLCERSSKTISELLASSVSSSSE